MTVEFVQPSASSNSRRKAVLYMIYYSKQHFVRNNRRESKPCAAHIVEASIQIALPTVYTVAAI